MGYQFPDAQEAVYALLDGLEIQPGIELSAYLRLQPGFADDLPDIVPVHIYDVGGNEGFIERVDRLGVDVYAIGTKAKDIAELIRTKIADQHHYVEGIGLIDRIAVEVVPHDVPYASATIRQAMTTYRVTSRPI